MKISRSESRRTRNVAARVHSSGVPLIIDTVWIENVSSHGARIRGQRAWQPHDRMVLTAVFGDFQIDARVIYCQRLAADDCAIGLKFDHPILANELA